LKSTFFLTQAVTQLMVCGHVSTYLRTSLSRQSDPHWFRVTEECEGGTNHENYRFVMLFIPL
jgi:hypothetical protein